MSRTSLDQPRYERVQFCRLAEEAQALGRNPFKRLAEAVAVGLLAGHVANEDGRDLLAVARAIRP